MANRIDLQQNTPEWEEFRYEKIGASDAPIIMESSPYKGPVQLWREKITRSKTYVSAAMQRGHDLEERARELACKDHIADYKPATFQSSKHEFMIASLDGYEPRTGSIIEIKCPNADLIEKIKGGDVPVHYDWQMQHQMSVMESEKAFLLVFDGISLFETVIRRDQKKIDALVEKEKEFYECMLSLKQPKCDKLPEKKDASILQALKEWKEAKLLEEGAKEKKEQAKARLIELSDNESFQCEGTRVLRILRSGGVDYKSIPELKGVDLKKYTKPAIEYWEVR